MCQKARLRFQFAIEESRAVTWVAENISCLMHSRPSTIFLPAVQRSHNLDHVLPGQFAPLNARDDHNFDPSVERAPYEDDP